MSVTLSDIARQVGASKMTVSQALRGTGRVGSQTRQRILSAAQQLGYRPNAAAHAISTGRFGCVALLLSTRGHGRSTLPEHLLGGIDGALSEHDLHLTIARLPDDKLTSEGVVPKILRQWMADGLLVNYNDKIPQRMMELIDGYNLPAVWLNAKRPYDCVHPDDFGAGRMLVEHLLKLGHRNILYVDLSHPASVMDEVHYSARDRLAGCRTAMEAAGLPLHICQRPQYVDREERQAIARHLLTQPDRPTAVIGYSDVSYVAMAAAELGIRMPQDLQLAAFADSEAHVGGVAVLTAVVPQAEMGRAAVETLIQKIADPSTRHPCRAIPYAAIL
jgi:LacI family transcriptional regulator